MLQLDEPALPQVLAGQVPTPSGYGTVRALPEPVAEAALAGVLTDRRAGHRVLHCCGSDVPYRLFAAAGADAVSVDAALIRDADLDAIGAVLDQGLGLWLGVLPGADAELERGLSPAAISDRVRGLWGKLGLRAAAAGRAGGAQPVLRPGRCLDALCSQGNRHPARRRQVAARGAAATKPVSTRPSAASRTVSGRPANRSPATDTGPTGCGVSGRNVNRPAGASGRGPSTADSTASRGGRRPGLRPAGGRVRGRPRQQRGRVGRLAAEQLRQPVVEAGAGRQQALDQRARRLGGTGHRLVCPATAASPPIAIAVSCVHTDPAW